MHRIVLYTLIILSATCCLHAGEDKIDGKLLVGKWEVENVPPGAKLTIEFTKDMKMTVNTEFQGKTQKQEGTYKLEKDQLSWSLMRDGKERKQTVTVVKLSEKSATLKDDSQEQVLKKLP